MNTDELKKTIRSNANLMWGMRMFHEALLEDDYMADRSVKYDTRLRRLRKAVDAAVAEDEIYTKLMAEQKKLNEQLDAEMQKRAEAR